MRRIGGGEIPYMWCYKCKQEKHVSTQAFRKYKDDGFKLKCPVCGTVLQPIAKKKQNTSGGGIQPTLLQFGGE